RPLNPAVAILSARVIGHAAPNRLQRLGAVIWATIGVAICIAAPLSFVFLSPYGPISALVIATITASVAAVLLLRASRAAITARANRALPLAIVAATVTAAGLFTLLPSLPGFWLSRDTIAAVRTAHPR